MHLRISPVLIAFATAQAAVEIVPPSPYMSSPPPVQADTSEIDPGRKPRILTVEPGTDEVWYSDWDLVTDRSPSGPLDVKGPRAGRQEFRVAFNNRGWPTELTYFDTKANPRWTKMFRYPARFPAGPGDVPFTASWINTQGAPISMAKLAATYKATTWKLGQKKYQVSDLLGEPLLVKTSGGGFGGAAETWIYLVDNQLASFHFNKDNSLVSLPEFDVPKVETPVVAPTPTPASAVDSANKAKPTTTTTKQKPAKK